METKVTEAENVVGRNVRIENYDSSWFLRRGRVCFVDRYGLFYVDFGGDVKPFHPSEVSFTTIRGES